MNKNKFSSLFLVTTLSAVVLAGCSMPTSNTSTSTTPSTSASPTSTDSAENADTTAALLSNTVITIPGQNITVKIVKPGVPVAYTENSGEVQGDSGTVTLGTRALKLGNNIIATFVVNRNGTDRDLYIGLFRNGSNGWELARSKSIGTNIDLVNIQLGGGGVTVNYLERGPDQAPTEAPNVPASKTFTFNNGQIEEVQN